MRLTIGKKLIGSFLFIAILLGLSSVISYLSITQINTSYSDLVDRRSVTLVTSKGIQIDAIQMNNRLRDYLLTKSESNFDEIRKHKHNLDNSIQFTLSMVKTQGSIDHLNEIQQLSDTFIQILNKRVSSNQAISIEFVDQELFPLSREIRSTADELAEYQQQLMNEASAENKRSVQSVITLIVAISIIAFVLAIGIGIIISRMISKPIVTISNAAEQIAAGDLTINEIRVKSRDETGQLANSFNNMVQNLRDLIYQVRTSAEQVAASSEELNASAEQTSAATEHIATSIQQVATGTDQQVQSVEETAQGINEMSKGVQQIADNAHSVYNTAIDASEKATSGNKTVQTAVNQMNSINSSIDGLSKVITGLGEQSKQIGQIVQVISDIAAQTNLLALNAAIEAARAGDQGRGFAVVADEVRKLAEQSAGSAEQISLLIGAIQNETDKAIQSMEGATNEVSDGITLVHSAGEAFGDIQSSINEVSKQIGDVSAAVQQISASTEQMIQSVDMISEIAEASAANTQNVSSATEEQLASMEEISASANSLSQMAEELQLLISRFKV